MYGEESKEITINVTVGDHNSYQPTKIDLTLASNYVECTEMFKNTNLNPENDLIIHITFPAKPAMDSMQLQENVGYLKNNLNLVKEPLDAKYSNLEVVKDPYSYASNLRLSFGFEPKERDAQDLTEIASYLSQAGIQNAELSLEVNQKIPQNAYDSDDAKLTGKFKGNVRVGQQKFELLLQNLINKWGPSPLAGFGTMFALANIDLKFGNFETLIDRGLIPWPAEIPRVNGFVGLKQFLVPQVGQLYSEIPRGEAEDLNLADLFSEVYTKVYDSIIGVTHVKFGFKGFVVTIKFEGFELFNGYLPDMDTIKAFAVPDAGAM